MKISTRPGDEGTTGLFGGGRVPKTDPRIAAYGTVDEMNAFIGLARSFLGDHPEAQRLDDVLGALQNDLFVLGADLATPTGARARTMRITEQHVVDLERSIDELEADLPQLKQFILPGGTPAASVLHVARTVCRRAERLVLAAADTADVSPGTAVYLNRLSDYLFVLGRWTNYSAGEAERPWNSQAPGAGDGA